MSIPHTTSDGKSANCFRSTMQLKGISAIRLWHWFRMVMYMIFKQHILWSCLSEMKKYSRLVLHPQQLVAWCAMVRLYEGLATQKLRY